MSIASDSPTTLVLLPGLDGTDVFFRPLLRVLPDWVRPIVVQLPAHGVDYPGLLDIVSHETRDIGAYWILGWSFSGPLALLCAEKEPQRIRGVILCASFVRAPRPVLAWCRFAFPSLVIGMIRVVRRLPLFLSVVRHAERRDKTETLSRVSAQTIAARVRALLTVDVRDVLRQCQVPIVYVASSNDSVVPRRNLDDVVAHAPATQVFVLDGPHLALYTNPRAAAEIICAVLRRGQ